MTRKPRASEVRLCRLAAITRGHGLNWLPYAGETGGRLSDLSGASIETGFRRPRNGSHEETALPAPAGDISASEPAWQNSRPRDFHPIRPLSCFAASLEVQKQDMRAGALMLVRKAAVPLAVGPRLFYRLGGVRRAIGQRPNRAALPLGILDPERGANLPHPFAAPWRLLYLIRYGLRCGGKPFRPSGNWSCRRDSNPREPLYKSGA